MKSRAVRFLKTKTSSILTFIVATFFFLFISDENIFQQFMPRRMCMFNNVKLISIHFLSDTIISVSYIVIGLALYRIYKVFEGLQLPWKGFLWMFAGFIFLCGITHAIGVLNLWVTFYWIDGLLKILTAIFSAGVALTLVNDAKAIKEMKVDFKMMAERLSGIIKEAEEKYQEIIKANHQNDNSTGTNSGDTRQ